MNGSVSKMIGRAGSLAVMLFIGVGQAAAQQLADRVNRGVVEIVAGRSDGTAMRMVEDLADMLNNTGTRRILPVAGEGSLQNIADVMVLRGIDIAVVQLDVLEYARKTLHPNLEQSLTYVAKLGNEELHLLARADVTSVNDLAGKKVNFGAPGDGASITGPAVFALTKVRAEATSYPPPLALEKMRSGEIAAMAYVGGKPVPFFSALTSADNFHFLSIPADPEIIARYIPAQLTSEDYPALISHEPIDTVSVGTAMVVANLAPDSERYRNIVNFVDAFFTQFEQVQQAPNHPKWHEINLGADLPGWKRFTAADAWLKRNAVASGATTNEQQLREIFTRFLDERTRLTGGPNLSAEEKTQMFTQFRQWQGSQPR